MKSASGSICPKNWILPSSDGGIARTAAEIADISDYDTKYGKTFTKLFTSYGYEFLGGSTPDIFGPINHDKYDAVSAPFYFSRFGHIGPNIGSLRFAGKRGLYWSNTITSDASRAYFSYLNEQDIHPSDLHYYWIGLSVRCVAR